MLIKVPYKPEVTVPLDEVTSELESLLAVNVSGFVSSEVQAKRKKVVNKATIMILFGGLAILTVLFLWGGFTIDFENTSKLKSLVAFGFLGLSILLFRDMINNIYGEGREDVGQEYLRVRVAQIHDHLDRMDEEAKEGKT